MIDPAVSPALGLMFLLGLRHGLDPDHVAVIDNIVFRAIDVRPRLAPWTGSFFALGHSLAVVAVALGVSLLSSAFVIPEWIEESIDVAVIALLLLVGATNLLALLRQRDYVPAGWRAGLVPAALRTSTHPLAVLAIGVIFGLVFDTATQAAAWGAAAIASGGTAAVLGIAGAFAAGMLIADTLDSQIVGRLLRTARGAPTRIRQYRRAVGWMVVALSFGMAGVGLCEMAGFAVDIDARSFSALGIGAAVLVIGLLTSARWRVLAADRGAAGEGRR